MPTIIAVDVSLSMYRPITLPDVSEAYQSRHLAIHGINCLLDYFANNCKLEFVSLVAFSYLYDVLSSFTRDYDSIKNCLNKLELFSKTCFESALNGIKAVVSDEWSNNSCQAILVTDGSLGIGLGSLRKSLQSAKSRQSTEEKFPLPFPFPCKLHIVCLGNPNDPEVRAAFPYYQNLIDLGGQGGELFTLDGPVTFKAITETFTRLAEKNYSTFNGKLICGNLKCQIQLFPTPQSFLRELDDVNETYSVCDKIEIIGFLDVKDVGSPPSTSRHLVLPRSMKDRSVEHGGGKKTDEEEDNSADDGKTPSFTVLLHGSLKVENMVAVARVQANWYGIIYSWADSKKKSNLMLSLFEPGQDVVPWLGSLDNLTSCKEYFPETIYNDEEKKSPFPLRAPEKRSYSQNGIVWVKPSGLQSDVQKVLRHARKLPDKIQQFYKELNRTRRAALSLGFYSLLESLATMLERECTLLPGTAHPNAAIQLTHAANALRSESATDISQQVMPLATNFAGRN